MSSRTRDWLAIGVVVLSAFWLTSCGQGSAPRIDLSKLEKETKPAPELPPDGRVLRMAVAPVVSPLQSYAIYQELLEYLGARLGRPVELVQSKTYAEINDLIRSGDVTLAFVCTNPYVQGKEDFGMELLVAPEVQGSPFYYSLLIVGRDSPITSLKQLRGRTFAFSDPLSNSGRLVPVYQLALLGERPESFFRRYIFTYAHDNSIRAVADGLVDGAAVDSLVYDYMAVTEPEVITKVKVVERWGPFGINPVVVNPGLDPQLKAKLREILFNMHQDEEGMRILRRLIIDRFIVPDDRIYDSVREMRAYLRARGIRE